MKRLDDVDISDYYKNNNHKKLIDLLLKYKNDNNVSPKLFFELGKAYFVNEEYAEAERYLKSVLKFSEFNVMSLDLLGKIYKIKNNLKVAKDYYKRILKIDDKNINAYKELIYMYFYDNKRHDMILKLVEKALLLNNNDLYLNVIKIKTHLLLKKYKINLNKEIDRLFHLIIKNKYPLRELIDVANFFATNKRYEESFHIISLVKDYKELRDEILSFFFTFQYDLSSYIREIRLKCKDVENKLNELLTIVPKYVIKIRNMIINELEIFRKEIVLKSKPRSMTIVLTNRCNLRCKMCKVWKHPWDINDIKIEKIKKLIPYLELITWQGGEVFLHKRFLELFDFAQQHNVKQEIITNGLLINEDIIKKIVDYGAQLTISIDSINKDIYEKIRYGASFSKLISVLESIKHYREIKSDTVFKIRMNTIISNENYLDLFNFMDFAKKYGINEWYIFPLNFDLTRKSALKDFLSKYLTIVEYFEKNNKEFFKKAKEFNIKIVSTMPDLKTFNGKLKDSYNIIKEYRDKLSHKDNYNCNNNYQSNKEIVYSKPLIEPKNKSKNKKIICTVPWQRLTIDKKIRPYCFCRFNIGKTTNAFNLNRLWNGSGMKKYRAIIINGDFKFFCNPSCYLGFVPKNQHNITT